ncbi:MAG TPA: tRNA preQ1(34) S-adenosylmethionine ribosyltransferase-isomerase QueA, partial [Spirochaetia bacterium]|nr:tRNA preQ1(34) S-adenosylmethionine ribosyltransferase-isomerase QueA [Spirochaetia bacterium]
MKTSDFSFELPEELIAQHPPQVRGSSRLMVLDPRNPESKIEHRSIPDLPGLLEPGSVFVINNSKVRRARIFGTSETGAKSEFLLVEPLPGNEWSAMVARARKHKSGKRYYFDDGVIATVTGRRGELLTIAFDKPIDDGWLERFGHVPLPPYIERQDESIDADRYQTIYADPQGSVAAPTAGLHLTEELLREIRARGVQIVTVTLHVGLGTFLPIRSESIEDHSMHEERYEVPVETAKAVTAARREGRGVIAVGTTSMRTLESAWTFDGLHSGNGATRLYIYPGYRFKVVDALLTNFHTPGSTLLVLVSAFAGRELIRTAYEKAVHE